MHSIFAGIHLQNKPNEFLPLNVDFGKTVFYLKEQVANKVQENAANLEIVYNGAALDDDLKLSGVMQPNATVHCFAKTKKYATYKPHTDFTDATIMAPVQELFNVIAHIQINVNSRVNILQKILAEYPEFRRNLGAQALIRDSVLFNTLHQPEVIKNIAENYPIICEAAPFIVDTIKKELTRDSTILNFLEPATDSTNSSEEENSLGATASVRNASGSARTTAAATVAERASESARIRMISRQQLQAALAQIDFDSVNSLSNIAHRISDTSAVGSVPLSNSASGERITSEVFRAQLQRAMTTLARGPPSSAAAPAADVTQQQQQMDTSEVGFDSSLMDDGSGDIPASYRNSPYAEPLRTMAQMGFVNYEENLTYLNITNGNIENAINLLMGSMN